MVNSTKNEIAILRHKLPAEETKRLAKLELIADKLRCCENLQNRLLQPWISVEECALLECELQKQLELRSELTDKPN